jgi:GWxTD domain-containing protein
MFFFVSGCIIRKHVKLDPRSEEFYKKARLLMTKQEEEVFLNLSDIKSRKEFIKEFWDIRDPNPYTEENEYREEIERRFEFASRRFKEGGRLGWDSDRGRIFILLGPPDSVREYPMLSGYYKGVIVWLYGNYQLAVRFVDKTGDGVYELITYNTDLLDALETAKYTLMGGTSFKYKIRPIKFKLSYKDRILTIKIETKNLLLKKIGDRYKTEIEIKTLIYYKDKTFEKIKRIKKMSFSKEEILKKKTITFNLPFDLKKKGKIHFDTIITDLLGNRRGRKIFKIKIK